MPSQNNIKKTSFVNWWKLSAALGLAVIGLFFGTVYMADIKANMFAGVITTFALGGAGLMGYLAFHKSTTGFFFNKRKYTGRENTIMLLARRDKATGKDVTVGMRVLEYKNIPKNARLRYVRNWKKHMYLLYNNLTTKKIEPVFLPDKKPFPPALFCKFAVMQEYQDYMEYNAPSMMQKLAPGILILVMIVIGILMVMTVPQGA